MSKCSYCESTGATGHQCDRCRIAELEAEVKLRTGGMQSLSDLANVRGYRIIELEESNQQYLNQLEEVSLDSIADKKRITNLESHIELHAGDVCSLNTDIDQLREQVSDLEAELAYYDEQTNNI